MSKVVCRADVGAAVASAKGQGKRVVFTNGCFDIIHVGHVRYLKAARAKGDVLVVGLNSDASVRKLKGDERPLVSDADRAEILAALECVDIITIFDEATPTELILEIEPDVHVKGGDYRTNDLPEAQAVRQVGGRVEVVSFADTSSEGRSTTNLIDRIIQVYGPKT